MFEELRISVVIHRRLDFFIFNLLMRIFIILKQVAMTLDAYFRKCSKKDGFEKPVRKIPSIVYKGSDTSIIKI